MRQTRAGGGRKQKRNPDWGKTQNKPSCEPDTARLHLVSIHFSLFIPFSLSLPPRIHVSVSLSFFWLSAFGWKTGKKTESNTKNRQPSIKIILFLKWPPRHPAFQCGDENSAESELGCVLARP